MTFFSLGGSVIFGGRSGMENVLGTYLEWCWIKVGPFLIIHFLPDEFLKRDSDPSPILSSVKMSLPSQLSPKSNANRFIIFIYCHSFINPYKIYCIHGTIRFQGSSLLNKLPEKLSYPTKIVISEILWPKNFSKVSPPLLRYKGHLKSESN